MATMKLPSGATIILDYDDLEKLQQISVRETSDKKYIRADVVRDGKNKTILAAAYILDLPSNQGFSITYKNRNPYDIRKENLIVTTTRNGQRPRKLNNSSGYKGVTWDKRTSRWMVTIRVNGKDIYLGRYADVIKAAETYNKAAIEHFGDKAVGLNDV